MVVRLQAAAAAQLPSPCPPLRRSVRPSAADSPAHAFIDVLPEVEGVAFGDLHFRFPGGCGRLPLLRWLVAM